MLVICLLLVQLQFSSVVHINVLHMALTVNSTLVGWVGWVIACVVSYVLVFYFLARVEGETAAEVRQAGLSTGQAGEDGSGLQPWWGGSGRGKEGEGSRGGEDCPTGGGKGTTASRGNSSVVVCMAVYVCVKCVVSVLDHTCVCVCVYVCVSLSAYACVENRS